MARKYLMSWDGKPNYTWVKMKGGVRYRVTCADLGIPHSQWTKEETYQAANAWWIKKRAELDSRPASGPHQDTIDDLTRKAEYAERHGLENEATALRGRIKEVQQLDADDTPVDPTATARIEAARLLGVEIPEDFDPTAASHLFGDERIWTEQFRREATIPKERTIGALADKWTAQKADQARAGVRSADGADNIRIALSHFKAFAGPANPVEIINAELIERWHLCCQAKAGERDNDPKAGWSVDYAAKVFGITRAFIFWLWEVEILASLPRCFSVKGKFRFERGEDEIPTFTNEEIKLLRDNATGQLRLHLLLMLNCGMTQKDISDLKKAQIDFAQGVIKRRRSKMEKKRKARRVTYPLWPVTLDLLKQHLSDDPVIALLTTTKRRWVRKQMMDNGKLKKADNIATNFQHLRKKVKLK